MSDELKVVAWMKANGTHMPRIRMLNETYLQGVWDFALVRLSDAEAALQAKEAEIAALKEDAERWRRLVNASEMAFPVAAIADDPENDRAMLYGRKRLEQFIDSLDEISDKYPAVIDSARAAVATQEAK
jgi:hypothetical protein